MFGGVTAALAVFFCIDLCACCFLPCAFQALYSPVSVYDSRVRRDLSGTGVLIMASDGVSPPGRSVFRGSVRWDSADRSRGRFLGMDVVFTDSSVFIYLSVLFFLFTREC